MKSLFDTRRVFIAIVALGLFAMAVRNVSDPDVWWHLQTGQLILQNHAVFHADPYSFTKLGQPWVNHEWLSDVLIFVLYRAGGWAWPIMMFAAITSAAFMLLFWRCETSPALAAAFTVWGAIASAPAWGVRPQTLSLLLASLFLLLLDRSRIRPNLLWWIVPLMPIWVNLHAEYVLGIGLIFLFLMGEVLDAALGFEEWAAASPRLRRLALALAACLAIVPLNPYGTRMYWYPLQTVHSRTIQMYISEWASPNFHLAMYLPAMLLLLATFVIVAISPVRVRPGDLLLLSVTAWEALHSARHVPILALVAAPILSKLLYAWWRSRKPEFGSGRAEKLKMPPIRLLNGIVLAGFLILGVLKVRGVLGTQAEVEKQFFPASAVPFLRENRLPGPLFNNYNWGGYLIWQLYPEYLVYIDGRSDLYGDSFMDQFAATYQISDASWRTALDQWQIQTVILPRDAPLISALRLIPSWKSVYQDSQATIFLKANSRAINTIESPGPPVSK